MAYFYNANLGFPAEVNGASQTGYQDVYYPVVSPVYVPESQLYNVVHAVEYNGTTYFFQDLIDFPVYRLYNVISYTPAIVVEENSTYEYLPIETVHSENVEQDIENIPENHYQPSAVEISSTEINEALSASVYIDNFESPGHDFKTINYENSWNTSYDQTLYGVNDPTSGIIENRLIQNPGVYENRSLERIEMRRETNLHFEHINYRWPSARNGCCLNVGPCQEHILGSALSQETFDTSGVKAEVKYKKESLYLTALSGKLYQKESIPVVDKMPVIEEVNNENSLIEFNNENIGNTRQTEEVINSNLFTEEFKKVCRGKRVQGIENFEVTETINDNDNRLVPNNENVLKVKKIDSVVQENILTKRSQKLYRRKIIQEFSTISVTATVAEEYAFDSCNENILKRERRIVKTDVCTVKANKVDIRENIQGLQRMPVIEKDADKECVVASCSKSTLKKERPFVKFDIIAKRDKDLYRKENVQVFGKMPVIEEAHDEECVVKSCNKNTPKKKRSFVKSDIYTKKDKELYRKESVEVFEKMPVIEEVPDEECAVESCSKNTIKKERPFIKSDILTKRAKDFYRGGNVQAFDKMAVIEEVPDKECSVESCKKNALKKERPFIKSDIFTKRAKELYRRENVQMFDKMPVIDEVSDEECVVESDRVDESKDTDTIYNAFLEDVVLKRNMNTKEKEKANVSEAFITDKTPMANVQGFSSVNVKDNKREIKSAAEKNTYEGTSLNPLNKDVYQNKCLETDTALENGNETAEESSEKPKRKRFQNVRKFFGRLLRCCSKVPTFDSDSSNNSQTYYFPSTIQNNGVNYPHENSFGFFDQGYDLENSHQYLENGYQPSESIFYPVVNQFYVPESHLYNVVHAVEYCGTTYFYETLEDFPVYNLCNVVTYTPAYSVEGNTSYLPIENVYTDNSEEYLENNSESDNQPSSVESFPEENNMCLYPSMNMSSFFCPEFDSDASISNNYWNNYIQSQCDVVENYHTNTRRIIRQENTMLSTEIYRNSYSEEIVTPNKDNAYYEQVNYGLYQLSSDLSLEGASGYEPIQDPVVPVEDLDKNAVKAQVKYKKDCIYLTALSGKLYQKQSIPVVERMPVLTEDEDEYPVIECNNEAVENICQNRSSVQINTCVKELCRRERSRVVENLKEINNVNKEDQVVDWKNGKLLKTKKQIKAVVRERTYTELCKKMYKKESALFVQKTHLEEVSDDEKVKKSTKNIYSKMERTYLVVEEKLFAKGTEELIIKERKQDFGKMPAIQEADDEDDKEKSNNINIPKTRHSVVQNNIFTRRSKNFGRKERSQDFVKMSTIEEVDEQCHLAEHINKSVLKINESVVHTNIFSERAKKLYKKESSSGFDKMPAIKEEENEDCVVEFDNGVVLKRSQCNSNVQRNASVMRPLKLHRKENIKRFVSMPLVKEIDEISEIYESKVLSKNDHIISYDTEELDNDTVKDNDGHLGDNGHIEKIFLAQENKLQSEAIEIPQEINKDANHLLQSTDVGKSPVVNRRQFLSGKCEEIKNKDNILEKTELKAPVENTAENMSLNPLSEEVCLEDSLETAIALESENDSTNEHSQKSKRKRCQNLRKFFARLLCCCSKGPT